MSPAPPWRHLWLGCLAGGLLLSPAVDAPAGWAVALAAAGGALAVALLARRRAGGYGVPVPACLAVCGLALLAGLGTGDARLAAADAGAIGAGEEGLDAGTGARVSGFVSTTPRALGGMTRFAVETSEGRIGAAVARPLPDLRLGARVELVGRVAAPDDWLAGLARRDGYALELRARRVDLLPGGRSGLTGYLDRARDRAEAGLTGGLDPPEAALARGFVLGQDDAIDPLVRNDFRRSGLAHLLAVSGQNVLLLALLAGLLLAAIGVEPRLRLLVVVGVIAAYVPIAGAGPSIQRAGIMGAAAILAGLAGRAADRVWIVLLAITLTLLVDPLSSGDIGWQLSFAAVIGIALWAGRISRLIERRLSGEDPPWLRRRVARPLAEALALTLAATLATAPLIAHHFGTVSLASLPANLAVLPAVAPVMWVGMLAAGLGQVPVIPAEPVTAILEPLLRYVAWVAGIFGRPSWASATLPEPGPAAVAAIYVALAALVPALLGTLERRRGASLARPIRLGVATAVLLAFVSVALIDGPRPGTGAEPPPGTLRITAVDVGQGDAILLEQARRPAALVDAGPPGAGIADSLRSLGVDRVGALLLTHDDLDHTGGAAEVLRELRVDRVLVGDAVPEATSLARLAHVPIDEVAEGTELRIGRLRLLVLSPSREPPGAVPGVLPSGDDDNARSVVLMARWGAWSALLTADAEAEATALAPGPFDVLKLAHHGSADAGLERLLETSAPRIALIGVGVDSRYGHPDETTMATLAEHGVCALRTDLDGNVGVELGAAGLEAFAARGLDGGRAGCEAAP